MKPNIAKKLLKKVKEDYNQISAEFDQTRKHSWKEFESFLEYISEGDSIADLGCGNGRLYDFLRGKKEIKYIGIDNSEELIKAAKKNFPEVKFKVGDLLDIPEKDESTDVAAAIASFHHIPSKELREKSVKEISRILKANGIFILSVWNLFQPRYKKYIRKSRIKSLTTLGKYAPRDTLIPWGKTGVMRYYYAFKEKELENLLKKAGFEILDHQKGNNLVYICRKNG
jgi:tRNA (uracil-5-)-methyltransferase TRM9